MHPSTALRRRYSLYAVRAGFEAEGTRQLCEFAVQRWKGGRGESLTANSHTRPSRPPRLSRLVSNSASPPSRLCHSDKYDNVLDFSRPLIPRYRASRVCEPPALQNICKANSTKISRESIHSPLPFPLRTSISTSRRPPLSVSDRFTGVSCQPCSAAYLGVWRG